MLTASLPASLIEEFRQTLAEATSGGVEFLSAQE